VWVVGDLYERDFQSVQVGSEAAITAPAYPGLILRGRVTYIDPRVDAQTRTAKVRVEMPSYGGRQQRRALGPG
jgi:multidrug efflux pump subunit AcrA (membrane-fusion protein)